MPLNSALARESGPNIDDSGSDDYTLTYYAAGKMTDDGENCENVWGAPNWLRKVNETGDQSLGARGHRYRRGRARSQVPVPGIISP